MANVHTVADLVREKVAASPRVDPHAMPKTPPYTKARLDVVPSGSAAKVSAYLGLLSQELGSDAAARSLRGFAPGADARAYLASLQRRLTAPETVAAATEKFGRLPAGFAKTLLFDADGHANVLALSPMLTAPRELRGWWDVFDILIAVGGILVCAVAEPCGAGSTALALVGGVGGIIKFGGGLTDSALAQYVCVEGTYMYPTPDYHSGNDYAESWMNCGFGLTTMEQAVVVRMTNGGAPQDYNFYGDGNRYSFASVLFTLAPLECATAYGDGFYRETGDPFGAPAFHAVNSAGPYCYDPR